MLLVFALLSVAGGILTAGLAMPAVGAASALTNASQQMFDELPSDFNVLAPSQVSVIRAADGTEIAQFYAENRIVVPLDKISPNMQNAIVAVEDQRFYQHKGIDPTGIVRAFLSNASGGSQGASTLTQQYVRNVLIEAGLQKDDPDAIRQATEKSAARKIREIKYALTLEKKYSKQQILEGYLNIAAFGPSTYGVEASAQHFFSHSAADLTVAEAALLAGLTNAPGAYDPVAFPDKAKDRMDWVLQKMYEEEFITEDQYNEAVATRIADMLHVTDTVGGCGTAGSAAYFCEYVTSEIENSELYGATEAERNQLLLRGGLTITTTLDMAKQNATDQAIAQWAPINDSGNVKTAVVSVEPGTGRILAMAQNTNYGTASDSDPTATQVSYSADASHGGLTHKDGTSGFQPGSTFKPFILAQWYKEGRSAYQTFNTNPTTLPASSWNISCAPELRDNYPVKNVSSSENGTYNVLDATRLSINVAYARMAQQMDICAITGTAQQLGVTKNDGSQLDPRPSITLGANAVTPLQMANAYATFAAHGTYCKPIAIDKIVDSSGQELDVPSADCNQVLDTKVADQVTKTLQTVVTARGTGNRAVLAGGREAAGKTGTTDDMQYVWFVGYTPSMSAAVWVGHSDGYYPIEHVRIGGRYYASMHGGDLPAPIWKSYTDAALAGTPNESFPDVSLGTPPARQGRSVSRGANTQEQGEGQDEGAASQDAGDGQEAAGGGDGQ